MQSKAKIYKAIDFRATQNKYIFIEFEVIWTSFCSYLDFFILIEDAMFVAVNERERTLYLSFSLNYPTIIDSIV